MPLIIPATQTLADTGFSIDNSCRFDAAEARMHKTPGSDGNRKTWTISFWWKKTSLAADPMESTGTTFFACDGNNPLKWRTGEPENDEMSLYEYVGGYVWQVTTTEKLFRDPTAWYHILVAFDSTQATDTNRIKMWINGTQYTGWTTTSWPSENHDTYMNKSGAEMAIGGWGATTTLNGLCAEFHLLDGTAVSDPDDFGERGDYGEWKPIKVSGLSYGTHGFYLDFADSSNLGNDANGGTDLTEAGITASDQMLDTPTNNFSTLNPAWQYGSSNLYGTLSEGNLKTTLAGHGPHTHPNTIPVSSGKWYWEVQVQNVTNNAGRIGICTTTCTTRDGTAQGKVDTVLLRYDGQLKIGTGGTDHDSHSGSFATGTVYILSFMLNLDDNQIEIRQNNVSAGGPESIPAGEYEVMSDFMSSSGTFVQWYNWGQDGTFAGTQTAQGNADDNGYGNFYYDVPAGFLAICSKNLTDCAITPSEHFNTVLWSGNTTDDTAITGVGFQPDFTWLKSRNTASTSHNLVDAVRGAPLNIRSDSNQEEENETTGLKSFDSDGFTLGIHSYFNYSGRTYVGWNWKANGSGSSNEDGSINTTATSANVAAGFSISTYTGTGSLATVGHGLSVAPSLVMVKRRNTAESWIVGTKQPVASVDWTDRAYLDQDGAWADNHAYWNDTDPTADVVTINTDAAVNGSSDTYVMYCFHNVEGYSKIGAYIGNSNTDGTFIYCGFRPAYVLLKSTSLAEGWHTQDVVRSPYNVVNENLEPDTSGAESSSSARYVDFLSNGFKLRTSDSGKNTGTYLFYAIAETPFKNANAR